jgi:hypothetical protein
MRHVDPPNRASFVGARYIVPAFLLPLLLAIIPSREGSLFPIRQGSRVLVALLTSHKTVYVLRRTGG